MKTIKPVLLASLLASFPGHPASAAQGMAFQTSVAPQADEDLRSACRYEITLMDPSRAVRGVWVIFDRGRDMLRYYGDPDVQAFAERHDLALMLPFHCGSKSSDTGGDMNVDPSKGIGRALFSALTQFAESSGHPELANAKLILLGFSGTGSLVGRFAEYAPDRVQAVIASNPGHFEPLGVDTIALSPKAAAIPQLVLAGSADRITGTQKPYAYFRKYFDQGVPWTFVVQNKAPHCCIINAKTLVLQWLDAVVVRRLTRSTGSYGFSKTRASEAADCPKPPSPIPIWWCGTTDTWGGANWSISDVRINRRPDAPDGMMPAGWLPDRKFARLWVSFVTKPEHPVTSLP
jgi:dienelactone hydrolase